MRWGSFLPHSPRRRAGLAHTAAGLRKNRAAERSPREEAATSCNQKLAVLPSMSHFFSCVRVGGQPTGTRFIRLLHRRLWCLIHLFQFLLQ